MDWNIAILGSSGCGKSTAIRAISDIAVVETDVLSPHASNTTEPQPTTVAMDLGIMDLGNGDKLRLHGAPGHARFDYMQDILLEQAVGALIVIDHRRAARLQDLEKYWLTVQAQLAHAAQPCLPVTVAVTHTERYVERDLAPYQRFFSSRSPCSCSLCMPPILWCDAREPRDVAVVMVVMAAVLESLHLHPESVLHQRMSV